MSDADKIALLREALGRIAWADVSADHLDAMATLRDAARSALSATAPNIPTGNNPSDNGESLPGGKEEP